MKNQANFIDKSGNRLTIVDQINDKGVIAIREQTSAQIDETLKEVMLSDYRYSFEEIIAIADKIKSIIPQEEKLTFS
jgi:hypothetical protein|tara:strand:- start:1002 stop:1232 length:231 start_codon:yes stop_codon:yes gene_type:complete